MCFTRLTGPSQESISRSQRNIVLICWSVPHVGMYVSVYHMTVPGYLVWLNTNLIPILSTGNTVILATLHDNKTSKSVTPIGFDGCCTVIDKASTSVIPYICPALTKTKC